MFTKLFRRKEPFFSNELFLALSLLITTVAITVTGSQLDSLSSQTAQQPLRSSEPTSLAAAVAQGDPAVLGRYIEAPRIFIYGDNKYSSGGVISQAVTDEKSVQISGYKLLGEVQIAVYEANEAALLNYLAHDKENQQINAAPNLSEFKHIATFDTDVNTSSYEGVKVPLPLGDTGIWYVQVNSNGGSVQTGAYVVRSRVGVVTKETNNELLFWGQDFASKRSVTSGTIRVLNLLNGPNVLSEMDFSEEGLATAPINATADIALVSVDGDLAVVPINLQYLGSYYSEYKRFMEQQLQTRHFIFTDRPLYQPGDVVRFKAILRDEQDVQYSIPNGMATVKIRRGYYGSDDGPGDFEQTYPVSADGTIDGTFALPANARVGEYSLSISMGDKQMVGGGSDWWGGGAIYFNVQFFRKPEYFLEIKTPQMEYISGDKGEFTINGSYFSGQPLANREVKYTVYKNSLYEHQYLDDLQWQLANLDDQYRYNFGYGADTVMEQTVTLDSKGEARVSLDVQNKDGASAIYSINAQLVTTDPEPARARTNVLVRAGEYSIYQSDYSYGVAVNKAAQIPVTLVPVRTDGVVQNVDLTAELKRTNWYYDSKSDTYVEEKDQQPKLAARTDSKGNAVFNFTPTKPGSYEIIVSGRDGSRNNLISKTFYYYVSSQDYPYLRSETDAYLNVVADKERYEPTDTARLTISSEIPNRDVLLTLERGSVHRYQIVRLEGKSGVATVPLVGTDIPNIFAAVSSFADDGLDRNVIDLPVSARSKQLVVTITTDAETYGPGETVNATITTTDVAGNPVSAQTAVWAVDKAIFELSDSTLGDIFDTFWFKRYNSTSLAHSLEGIVVETAEGGGGCFAAGTQITMANGSSKNIENVQVGEYVLTRTETSAELVKAKVTSTHKAAESGYLIINGELKVTADHILWANKSWQTAGNLRVGDSLTNSAGQEVAVNSIEWQRGAFSVYNLEIDQHHSYFANGVWVHNQKGEPRSVFEDTAYWNPTVRTDGSGRAQVSFKLPDNLTTWTMAAVGTTVDTRVGQTTHEIVVTKDVIVRPILPNILRVGDELFVSALVQNFTQQAQAFAVELAFDSGEIEQPASSQITLDAGQMRQLDWRVRPKTANEIGKFTFSATAVNDENLGDTITQTLPILNFGFSEKSALTGQGSTTFPLSLSSDAGTQESKVTLSLAPTMTGSLISAMDYLIEYPYGCVEQTTSRLVPAIIAKSNPDLFGSTLADKDVDSMIEKGLNRLAALQLSDGGWSWWYGSQSDPFVTAYVVEYLLQAKAAGIAVDSVLLARAQTFLETPATGQTRATANASYELVGDDQRSRQIVQNYALVLLGAKDKVVPIANLKDLRADVLAMAVMTNYRLGDADPQTNGLNLLQEMAQTEKGTVYWVDGAARYFGSKDASTALAIRAIVLANGDRQLASKAAAYLMRSRQTEYWSNTFGTAQAIRAIVDLSHSGDELTPNYAYTVALDGKQVASGRVATVSQTIAPISVPTDSIKPEGSELIITQEGEGQLYSTLLVDQFHTDPASPAVSNGIQISRQYLNLKNKQSSSGEKYSLAVGDTVKVVLTVSGLAATEQYALIQDELPAGLIPINERFNNEAQSGQDNWYGYNGWYEPDVSSREITQNGIIISLYQLSPGVQAYEYKARVVSEGTFTAPPAIASLMYEPQVYGRTAPDVVITTGESKLLPRIDLPGGLATRNLSEMIWLVGAAVLLTAVGVVVVLRRRRSRRRSGVTANVAPLSPPMPPVTEPTPPRPPSPPPTVG